ncbi:MAG: hypothetical protein RLZZ299_2047 [Pseudomonadota bacterium]|jgi:hypothetical protein
MPAVVPRPATSLAGHVAPPGAGWVWIATFALAWGLAPVVPFLGGTALAGHPSDALYTHASTFAHHLRDAPEEGVRSWIAWLVMPLGASLGAPTAWAAGMALARFATVLCAWSAARAWGLGRTGAILAATAWGASPLFHAAHATGDVDSWDATPFMVALWVLRRPRGLGARHGPGTWLEQAARVMVAAGALAWALASRNAWGAVGASAIALAGVGAGVAGRRELAMRCALTVLLGIALARGLGLLSPAPVADAARMHASWHPTWPTPSWIQPVWTARGVPFAGTLLLLAAAVVGRVPFVATWALVAAVLATGEGPWYDLPLLRDVSEPWRWLLVSHAALCWLAGHALDAWTERPSMRGAARRPWLAPLAVVPWIETSAWSPVPLVLPAAPAEVPAMYDAVRGPALLDVPGPQPAGTAGFTPRARYLVWARDHHGAADPWREDARWLAAWRAWDPATGLVPVMPPLTPARDAAVSQVLVHRDLLGARRAAALVDGLVAQGARVEHVDDARTLLTLDAVPR